MSGSRHATVKIYRASSWPGDAPSPASLETAGEKLRCAVNASLTRRTPRTLDRVIINANRRISVSIAEPKRRSAQLRIHWLLVDHPSLPQTITETLQEGSFPPSMRMIVESIRDRAKPGHSYAASAQTPRPQGAWIHLGRVLESVARHIPAGFSFDGVSIGWGRRGSSPRRRQRSIKLGSMVERERMIRVHPVLDDPWVPGHVIEYVVFHELCHYLAPPLTSAEARAQRENRIHHRAFRILEEQYPEKQAAEEWIDRHLDILLKKAAK